MIVPYMMQKNIGYNMADMFCIMSVWSHLVISVQQSLPVESHFTSMYLKIDITSAQYVYGNPITLIGFESNMLCCLIIAQMPKQSLPMLDK